MARTTILCTISLPPDLLRQTDQVAQKKYRTRSALIQIALREYFANPNNLQ